MFKGCRLGKKMANLLQKKGEFKESDTHENDALNDALLAREREKVKRAREEEEEEEDERLFRVLDDAFRERLAVERRGGSEEEVGEKVVVRW